MLEERGLIEDPPKKKFVGVLMAVALLLPVNFTSTTQNGSTVKWKVEAISYSYVQQQKDGQTEREFKLKVRDIAKQVKDNLIPAVESALGDLTDSSDAEPH